MDTENYIYSCIVKISDFQSQPYLSEIVDSTSIAMATKSENASIVNTFVPGTMPMQ